MLRVAHISNGQVRPKKLTQKELIHNAAIESLAVRKAKDKQDAEKKFSNEITELQQLEYEANK